MHKLPPPPVKSHQFQLFVIEIKSNSIHWCILEFCWVCSTTSQDGISYGGWLKAIQTKICNNEIDCQKPWLPTPIIYANIIHILTRTEGYRAKLKGWTSGKVRTWEANTVNLDWRLLSFVKFSLAGISSQRLKKWCWKIFYLVINCICIMIWFCTTFHEVFHMFIIGAIIKDTFEKTFNWWYGFIVRHSKVIRILILL